MRYYRVAAKAGFTVDVPVVVKLADPPVLGAADPTTELTAWYAASFILETIVLLAVALYGFRTSLAGQRVVGWLDE